MVIIHQNLIIQTHTHTHTERNPNINTKDSHQITRKENKRRNEWQPKKKNPRTITKRAMRTHLSLIYLWLCCAACQILVLWPGTEPMLLAVKVKPLDQQGIPSITTLNINRLQRLQSNDKGWLNGYKNNTHTDVAHKSLTSDLKMKHVYRKWGNRRFPYKWKLKLR